VPVSKTPVLSTVLEPRVLQIGIGGYPRRQYNFPTAAALVDSSKFVDDFAAGAEDSIGVITIHYQLSARMRKISFPMGKWASNFETSKNIWSASGLKTKSITQVLGVS
jgi:hypothetical protein